MSETAAGLILVMILSVWVVRMYRVLGYERRITQTQRQQLRQLWRTLSQTIRDKKKAYREGYDRGVEFGRLYSQGRATVGTIPLGADLRIIGSFQPAPVPKFEILEIDTREIITPEKVIEKIPSIRALAHEISCKMEEETGIRPTGVVIPEGLADPVRLQVQDLFDALCTEVPVPRVNYPFTLDGLVYGRSFKEVVDEMRRKGPEEKRSKAK